MTSPSHSPSKLEEEPLHTTNPNPSSAQDEENLDQQQPPPPSQSQPQSPQTLETPDSPNPEQADLNHPEEDHQQQEQKEVAEAPEFLDQVDQDNHDNPQKSGMTLSPPPVLQPITDPQVISDDLNPPPLTSPTNPNRRPNKRKKGGRSIKKQQAIEKKLKTLTEKLKPIPFVPSKVLDFLKHEKLLKGLGLWDFVHIQFDFPTRVDLIAQLIATYDLKSRCSYVNESRVKINRADLARAFKLPVKKEKGNVLEGVDLDSEAMSEESISFMEDFVSNWVLLHDDTWMMPSEVLNWTRAIKDGHPEKVDWASVFWFMVEKELTQGEQLEDCYYASHLQYLIKSQREDLLREEPKVDLEVDMKEEEDVGDVDLKMGGSNECQGQDNVVSDEPNIELSLGQDIVEKEEVKDDDMMDVEECLEEEENRQWLLDGKNNLGDHFLQPCHLEKGIGSDINEETNQEDEQVEEEEAEEEAEEEPEDEFNIPPNDDMLERNGLTGNLLQVMETTQLPFSLQGQLSDPSPVEFVASRDETHTISAGPSIFGIGSKREIGHEHDISHHSLNGSNKRLRTDGRWDLESSDLGMCMEQAQQWMEKARMAYETKEQTFQDSNMRQQLLLSELQQRDSMMEHMLKTKCEEIQKKNGEIFRLERELYVMGNLLDGYRKALKETNKAFFEYRQRCQLPEEPLYKDAGPGGLILSTTELEKQRQKQEEEDRLNRIMIEQKFKDAEKEYISKFEVYLNKVSMLDDRLMDFENKVKLLKELSAKPKVSETPGCAPSE